MKSVRFFPARGVMHVGLSTLSFWTSLPDRPEVWAAANGYVVVRPASIEATEDPAKGADETVPQPCLNENGATEGAVKSNNHNKLARATGRD